jgi:hypothetical protein
MHIHLTRKIYVYEFVIKANGIFKKCKFFNLYIKCRNLFIVLERCKSCQGKFVTKKKLSNFDRKSKIGILSPGNKSSNPGIESRRKVRDPGIDSI